MRSSRRTTTLPTDVDPIRMYKPPQRLRRATTCTKVLPISLNIRRRRKLSFNFVTHSPNGLDVLGIFGLIPQFAPQVANVDHDRVVAALEVLFAPYLTEQLFGTDHLP